VSADPLWGILGITAFALAGFGLLAAGGLIQRLPQRLRANVGAVGLAFYAAFLSAGLYQAIFREGGLIDSGLLPPDVAMAAWVLLSLLVVGIAIRRARAFATSNRSTGTGTSA
jgi:hypothetical protein